VVTFFDKIEPGMYRVRYLARATSIGSFVVPPTRIEAMYAPEIYGRTAATALTRTREAVNVRRHRPRAAEARGLTAREIGDATRTVPLRSSGV
jgi:hypothetical protein